MRSLVLSSGSDLGLNLGILLKGGVVSFPDLSSSTSIASSITWDTKCDLCWVGWVWDHDQGRRTHLCPSNAIYDNSSDVVITIPLCTKDLH